MQSYVHFTLLHNSKTHTRVPKVPVPDVPDTRNTHAPSAGPPSRDAGKADVSNEENAYDIKGHDTRASYPKQLPKNGHATLAKDVAVAGQTSFGYSPHALESPDIHKYVTRVLMHLAHFLPMVCSQSKGERDQAGKSKDNRHNNLKQKPIYTRAQPLQETQTDPKNWNKTVSNKDMDEAEVEETA
jgi:hypothetical protein